MQSVGNFVGTRKCLAPTGCRAAGASDHPEDALVCHHRHRGADPALASHLGPLGRPCRLLRRWVNTAQDSAAFVLTFVLKKIYILFLDTLAAFADKYKSMIEQNSFKHCRNSMVIFTAILIIDDQVKVCGNEQFYCDGD